MKNIITNTVLTGRQYLELITNNYYFDGNTQNEIEGILNSTGHKDLWSFPLEEIDEIMENQLRVVLVLDIGC